MMAAVRNDTLVKLDAFSFVFISFPFFAQIYLDYLTPLGEKYRRYTISGLLRVWRNLKIPMPVLIKRHKIAKMPLMTTTHPTSGWNRRMAGKLGKGEADWRGSGNAKLFHPRADLRIHRIKIGEAVLSVRSPYRKHYKKKDQDHPAEKKEFAEHTTYFLVA